MRFELNASTQSVLHKCELELNFPMSPMRLVPQRIYGYLAKRALLNFRQSETIRGHHPVPRFDRKMFHPELANIIVPDLDKHSA